MANKLGVIYRYESFGGANAAAIWFDLEITMIYARLPNYRAKVRAVAYYY